jgi:probable HAF family extracellular repeat protein
MVPLGLLPGGDSASAQGVSGDGSVIVGLGKSYNTPEYDEFEAFKWTADTGMVGLGDLPGGSFDSVARDVTADGATIVGNGTTVYVNDIDRAVRWAESGAIEDLGALPGVHPSVAHSYGNAVSPDGSVIAGWARNAEGDQEACIWTGGEGPIGLGDLAGRGSLAWDVAVATETVVVGRSYLPGGAQEAFRWTETGGMVGLGDLPGGLHSSVAHAISADGSTIVGFSSGDPGGAFIWDEEHGMRDLKVLLEDEFGFDLSEWSRLTTAHGISDDGQTIVGGGSRGSVTEAWVAHIPEPATGLLLLMGCCLIIRRHTRVE